MTSSTSNRRPRAAIAGLLALAWSWVLVAPAAAVVLQAHITASFGAPTVPLNGTTTLSFLISNPNTGALSNVGFTDVMPAGLVVQTAPTSNDCGGTVTSSVGSISLSGGSIGAQAICLVSGAIVKGTTYGLKTNSATVTSSAGTGNTSTPTLVVAQPPTGFARIGSSTDTGIGWTPVGSTVTLDVEVDNPNTATSLTGVGFSGTLPAGLTIANPNGLSVGGGCTIGEVTATAGSHAITVTGATLGESTGNPGFPSPSELCDISLHAVASVSGDQVFTTGPIASVEGGNGPALTADVPVIGPGPRVYWGDYASGSFQNGHVNFGRLDGSVAGLLYQSQHGGVAGTAIDAAAGRIYWLDAGLFVLRWAALDDSTQGTVSATGASMAYPWGLALNPATHRLFWASFSNNSLGYADVNAPTAGNLYTSASPGITLAGPTGVAIDPAANRIYWTNSEGASPGIGFANLDGTGGGGTLNVAGATLAQPMGLALDKANGLVYWANAGGTISYAHLDGSGGGDLSIFSGFRSQPTGVAYDPTLNEVVWGNATGSFIGYAQIGQGSGTLGHDGITPVQPVFPSILYPPQGTAAPTLTGSGKPGAQLACGKGTWAPDLLGASLYRVPASYAYHWQRNGVAIAGATASTYTPSATGDYTCTVTAANAAGPTTSAPSRIADSLPPTVSAPTVTPATGSTIGSSASVRVTWSGSDAGSGIAHYEVWLSTNGGSYVKLSSPTSASYARALPISSTTTYRFRVRAFDQAGNVSGFAYGATFHVKAVQQTSTSVHWSGSWTTTTTSSASGGSYRSTTTAGASVSYTFTGRAIGVVGTEGTGFGAFNVYLDGVLVGTGSDYATSTLYRRIVYSRAWSTSATHTIKLVCTGTAGHPRIDVDAFVILG